MVRTEGLWWKGRWKEAAECVSQTPLGLMEWVSWPMFQGNGTKEMHSAKQGRKTSVSVGNDVSELSPFHSS